MLRLIFAVSIAAFFSNSALAQNNKTTVINKVIMECVAVVQKSSPELNEMWTEEYFAGFDAYYDPVTGRVHNNAEGVAQSLTAVQQVIFVFDKCMAQKGFSLKP